MASFPGLGDGTEIHQRFIQHPPQYYRHLLRCYNKSSSPQVLKYQMIRFDCRTESVQRIQLPARIPTRELLERNDLLLRVQVDPYNECLVANAPCSEMNTLPNVGRERRVGVQSKLCQAWNKLLTETRGGGFDLVGGRIVPRDNT